MNRVYVGVDLGGTNVKIALADFEFGILAQDSIPTESHRGPDDVLNRIAECIERLGEEVDASLSSVGIGVPGLADVKSGVTKFLPNLPTQWVDVPVAKTLSQRLDCPVSLLNDARTATLAELRLGRGRDRDNPTFAFFTLGTGVGGGIVVDGKLRVGPLGAAGELGHQTILADGARCGCGSRGCLETLASGPAIAAEGMRLVRMGLAPELHGLVKGDVNQVTTREMAIAADKDPYVREAIVTAATYLGIAAANVVTCIHPEMIVLGGGVAEIGDLLTETVKQTIQDRVGMFPTDDIVVTKSQLGDKAGVMGAIALAEMRA